MKILQASNIWQSPVKLGCFNKKKVLLTGRKRTNVLLGVTEVTYPYFMMWRFQSFITSFSPSLTSVKSSII
jgi:hypothetical protein